MKSQLNKPIHRVAVPLVAALATGVGMAWAPSAWADGNVSARVSGATLIIRGDEADNNVIVNRFSDGISVTGRADTIITGASSPFGKVSVSARNIDINMRGGNDVVRIEGGSAFTPPVERDLVIDGERGDDTIKFFSVKVAGDTQINAEQGDDIVFIDGAVDVDNLGFTFVRPEFTGRFGLTTDDGQDFVEINNALFRNGVDVRLGSERDAACSCFSEYQNLGQTQFNGGDGRDGFVAVGITNASFPQMVNDFRDFPDDCSFLGGRQSC